MTTHRQRRAARANIQKAQKAWRRMSRTEHARAQPEGRRRSRPGTTGEGGFYRIQVRPKSGFVAFRNQDVGEPGHVQRLAGRRATGSWSTASWLVSKQDAHREGNRLVPDSPAARKVLSRLGSNPAHLKGDIFEAEERPNVPERAKPTAAQRQARMGNIRKAQAARRSRARVLTH